MLNAGTETKTMTNSSSVNRLFGNAQICAGRHIFMSTPSGVGCAGKMTRGSGNLPEYKIQLLRRNEHYVK